MLSDDDVGVLLRAGEADNVEFAQGASDRRKFGEAICAFANDLADRRKVGALIVSVRDDGSCADLAIDEQLLQTFIGFVLMERSCRLQ